ncbi:pre-mRNA-processing protein prp40 [Anaeramoeba flamelloides]|uniref:Pre-mRNA-processing protein prp40 n=1 Tax=Anaeramoeba flamelloides TaxID=1746091 RepID=A0ABQ8XFY2_9EUKA|nr:pre-mRNA-processing protein prp40 [Anaeramoeba flamelloides]
MEAQNVDFWYELWNSQYQIPYYYHTNTKQSTWEKPKTGFIVSVLETMKTLGPVQALQNLQKLVNNLPSIYFQTNNNRITDLKYMSQMKSSKKKIKRVKKKETTNKMKKRKKKGKGKQKEEKEDKEDKEQKEQKEQKEEKEEMKEEVERIKTTKPQPKQKTKLQNQTKPKLKPKTIPEIKPQNKHPNKKIDKHNLKIRIEINNKKPHPKKQIKNKNINNIKSPNNLISPNSPTVSELKKALENEIPLGNFHNPRNKSIQLMDIEVGTRKKEHTIHNAFKLEKGFRFEIKGKLEKKPI